MAACAILNEAPNIPNYERIEDERSLWHNSCERIVFAHS